MVKIHSFTSVNALNEALAAYIMDVAHQAIAERGRFNFVLTGGSSPKALYRYLASRYRDEIHWDKVYFFFGDERNVLPEHDDYNGRMADEYLLRPLHISQDHIFYVNTSLAPEQAAADYETRIQAHFRENPVVFDLILLGMGDDAHTASIFPGTDLTRNDQESVAAVWVEKLNTYRISMTAARINKARHIAFIVFGENKAAAIRHVLRDPEKDVNRYPAQLIEAENGHVDWFIDDAAAALL